MNSCHEEGVRDGIELESKLRDRRDVRKIARSAASIPAGFRWQTPSSFTSPTRAQFEFIKFSHSVPNCVTFQTKDHCETSAERPQLHIVMLTGPEAEGYDGGGGLGGKFGWRSHPNLLVTTEIPQFRPLLSESLCDSERRGRS
eukprot:gene19884-biopygen6371